jgi:hypothetical protein
MFDWENANQLYNIFFAAKPASPLSSICVAMKTLESTALRFSMVVGDG